MKIGAGKTALQFTGTFYLDPVLLLVRGQVPLPLLLHDRQGTLLLDLRIRPPLAGADIPMPKEVVANFGHSGGMKQN